MALGSLTLAQIRLAAQQRADQVSSNFVTTPEWNSYINESLYELYDLLITSYGEDYYVAAPLQFPTDGTSELYALPNGTNYNAAPAFYKLLGVDLGISGSNNSFVTLKPFKFSDRNKWSTPNIQSFYNVSNLRYRILGTNLLFTPIPSAGQTIQLWYVPRMTELVSDDSVADGVSGWLEYVICDAAIKAMQKEESDISVLAAQKEALRQRIVANAPARDAGMPQTVGDTQSLDSTGFWDGGNNYGGSGY